MTNNYCTLFNINYLAKGLAMISSLQEKSRNAFRMYVLAFDNETEEILKALQIPNVVVFSLKDFENQDLQEAKKDRSLAEYCWTCTPAVIKYCIEKYHLPECTYVDADLFFFQDPEILLAEVRRTSKSVLITPHNYTPIFDQTAASGIFCVQFMYFKNNSSGMKVLSHWYRQCIDWCYARVEEGKFGDQKYLDIWPQEFSNEVHVLENQGALAPWNIQRFDPVIEEAIFYHFHGFSVTAENQFFLGWYPLSTKAKQKLYAPYMKSISDWESKLGQKFKNLYRRTYSIDKKHYWLRWMRRQFLETFYFLTRTGL